MFRGGNAKNLNDSPLTPRHREERAGGGGREKETGHRNKSILVRIYSQN